jgi:hypothetical protein
MHAFPWPVRRFELQLAAGDELWADGTLFKAPDDLRDEDLILRVSPPSCYRRAQL